MRCRAFASSRWPTSGAGLFGYGSTSIRTTQDLQLIAGLPPLVRAGRPLQRDGDRAQWRGTADGHRRQRAGRRQAAGDRAAPCPARRRRCAGTRVAGHRAGQRRAAGLGAAGAGSRRRRREGCAEGQPEAAAGGAGHRAAGDAVPARQEPQHRAGGARRRLARARRRHGHAGAGTGRGGGRPAPLLQATIRTAAWSRRRRARSGWTTRPAGSV